MTSCTNQPCSTPSAGATIIMTSRTNVSVPSPFRPEDERPIESKELWLAGDHTHGDESNCMVLLTATSAAAATQLAATHFLNGFTIRKVTSLEDLRISLDSMVPSEERADGKSPSGGQGHTRPHRQQPHTPPSDEPRCSSSMPFLQPLNNDEVKRFELFRSVIDHEDNLLNERVSWIILAQSFLMAAFVTSSQSGNLSMLLVAASVGLATVIVTLPAIFAAGRNIEVQQQVYFRQVPSDERCLELHGHKRDLTRSKKGQQLSRSLQRHDERSGPPIFSSNPMSGPIPDNNDLGGALDTEAQQRLKKGHIFPNMAFRSRASVPILYTVTALAAVQFFGWIFLLVALLMEWP